MKETSPEQVEKACEVWKPIFDGRYEVSNHGRLRRGERILNPATNQFGYLRASIWVNGKRLDPFVHRLVAEAFLGPIPEGKTVDHINENKTNNRADNLQFLTRGDNARKSNLRVGEDHPLSKLDDSKVRRIRARRSDGWSYPMIATEIGCSPSIVADVCKKRRWAHVI